MGMIVLQLAWTRPIPLPAAEPALPLRLPAIVIQPVHAARVIVERSLFGRLAGPGTAGAGAPAGPLDGAMPVGVVMRGGRALAFLQAPDGAAVALAAGSVYHGWTLLHVGLGGIRVQRGTETVSLPLKASRPATTDKDAQ